ncbi:hypothetical protein HYPSUDRAFT_365051 [Hypholoma sublateritium FD-334 SS-4]|uniref:Uncharacterized protein n=1 Tax=Hypholoma sublateritium (strain FD-334 SS-4) TaxID=945553 RepID=A0A0D2NFT3_HYPSF|nr:hypothetical protein HYPSUDRAFT_365051 [Hypholoma sublateritium FD-334 SS-4]
MWGDGGITRARTASLYQEYYDQPGEGQPGEVAYTLGMLIAAIHRLLVLAFTTNWLFRY